MPDSEPNQPIVLANGRLWTVEEWYAVCGGERTFELVRAVRKYETRKPAFDRIPRLKELYNQYNDLAICTAILMAARLYDEFGVHRTFQYRAHQIHAEYDMIYRTSRGFYRQSELFNLPNRITNYTRTLRKNSKLTKTLRETIIRRCTEMLASKGVADD
jgi:hypothetical protein